jgi:hypothetical protein
MEMDAGDRIVSRKGRMKRCHECGRRFGLVRHQWGIHQFCTRACVRRYKTRLLEEGREWWLMFARPPVSLSALTYGRVASGLRRYRGRQ